MGTARRDSAAAEVDLDEVIRRFRQFAEQGRSRTPVSAALRDAVADRPQVAALLLAAPTEQRLPVLLLAAVHRVLLDHPDDPLAAWFPNLAPAPRSPDDPGLGEALERFVDSHRATITELVAMRSTQTNEVGRCGPLLVALALLGDEVGPLGLVDVGTSAGLNLLLDRYSYRFSRDDGETAELGGPSPVHVEVSVRGDVPLPRALPVLADRRGVDRSPIDPADPDSSRWLTACVWPDQPERFHRLEGALALAAADPPTVVAGDAVQLVAQVLQQVAGHPVVMNSWVLNYFSPAHRRAYVAELDRVGAQRDLSWVLFEEPRLVPELPVTTTGRLDRTTLTLVRWRGGRRTCTHLASCHPHGFWMHAL